jgi:hypothetical protein
LGTTVGAKNYLPIDGAQQFYRTTRTAAEFEMAPPDNRADDGQIVCKTAYEAANGTPAETITFLCLDAAGNKIFFRTLVLSFTPKFGGSEDLITRMIKFQPDPSSFVEA